jgi:alpha-L-fucosidase 2
MLRTWLAPPPAAAAGMLHPRHLGSRTALAAAAAWLLHAAGLALLCASTSTASDGEPPAGWPSAYNVKWTERAEWSAAGALGSMPLGSGRTGLNLWADDAGLRLLFSATDSYDEHNLLMKLGQVNIELQPNPFAPLPPTPPPPAPPPPPRPHGLSAFSTKASAIGCANAGCTNPQDPRLMRFHNCSSAASCPTEVAAACAAWTDCQMFSIDPHRAAQRAQLFGLCASATSLRYDKDWNSWYLNTTASNCPPPPPPKVYPAFDQELDLERGLVTVRSGAIVVEVFVDWLSDVTRVQVNSTDSSTFAANISTWLWRNQTTPVCEGTLCMPIDICPTPTDSMRFAADTIVDSTSPELLWYRRNPARTSVDASLAQQLLPSETEGSRDTLGNNTFGMLISQPPGTVGGNELHKGTDGTLQSGRTNSITVMISAHVNQTSSAQAWQDQLRGKMASAEAISHADARVAHATAWRAIWTRSWMHSDAPPGSEQYNNSMTIALGRYVNLCQGRGDTPTHFTGGIFTTFNQDSKGDGQYSTFSSYDFRSWGSAYWWQNTRFAYDPMLGDGDYETMAPLFDLYSMQLPTVQALVKAYYKHDGAKFYETATPQGTTVMDQWGCADTAGGVNATMPCDRGKPNPKAPAQMMKTICRPKDLYSKGCSKLNNSLSDCDAENPFIRHHFSSSIEVPLMMLRHWLHTYNATAAKRWLVPVAVQTMMFMDEHWKNAKFFMQDAQALESYSHCDQPACDLSGLRQLLRGLLLPEVTTLFSTTELAMFSRLQARVNATKLAVFTTMDTPHHAEHFKETDLPLLAPCAEAGVATVGYQPGAWTQQNREPIAMYAVWPYELFGVNRTGMAMPLPDSLNISTDDEALALAVRSYKLQPYPGNPEGYNMISVFSANLGLVNTTRAFLRYKWSTAVKAGPNDYNSNRFPVWWGPSNRGGEVCDDPGCNEIADEARIALQHMLLQSDNHGERLLLFPAWPKEHDLQFKIHAERDTTLVGELKNGKLRSLTVTPKDRQKDVIVLPLKSDDAAAPSLVSTRPSIVFCLVDDLGWNTAYNNKQQHTPTIDSLAAAGVRLTSFYTYRYVWKDACCIVLR